MAFASYALMSACLFVLVLLVWQVTTSRWAPDPLDRLAARRAAGTAAAVAGVLAAASVVTRLLL